MRNGRDGETKKKGEGGINEEKQIMAEIVATNVVASQLPNGVWPQHQLLVPIGLK